MDFLTQVIFTVSLFAIVAALALWVDKGSDYEDHE